MQGWRGYPPPTTRPRAPRHAPRAPAAPDPTRREGSVDPRGSVDPEGPAAAAPAAAPRIRTADAALRARIAAGQTPALFAVDERAVRRFWTFFAADLRNANTRAAEERGKNTR